LGETFILVRPGAVSERQYIAMAKPSQGWSSTRNVLPDPNDEMVLETAIIGRADAIVTFNDENFSSVAAGFRYEVGGPWKSFADWYRKPSDYKRGVNS